MAQLNPKQALFVERYLQNGCNGSRAVREAGYSCSSGNDRKQRSKPCDSDSIFSVFLHYRFRFCPDGHGSFHRFYAFTIQDTDTLEKTMAGNPASGVRGGHDSSFTSYSTYHRAKNFLFSSGSALYRFAHALHFFRLSFGLWIRCGRHGRKLVSDKYSQRVTYLSNDGIFQRV